MLRRLQHLRRFFQRDLIFRPLLRCKVGDIPVCAFGNAGEHVAQILMQIDAPSPTVLDNCVDSKGSGMNGAKLRHFWDGFGVGFFTCSGSGFEKDFLANGTHFF